MRRLPLVWLLCAAMAALLSACAGSSHKYTASPASGYKVGQPYRVNGKRYVPHVDPDYREEGIASWYGEDFHGRRTADGEVYNMNALTAAHTTLPMPANVRVTNLENGRSAVLRVNDRGPFAHDRIIDVSKEAARQLGFLGKGTARVRVEYLGLAPLAPTSNYMVADASSAATPTGKPLRPSQALALPSEKPETVLRGSQPALQTVAAADNTPQPASQTVPRPMPAPASLVAESVRSEPHVTPVAAGMLGQGGHSLFDRPAFYISTVFSNPLDAELARQNFSELGSASISPGKSSGLGDYYIVKLGPFDNERSAQRTIDQLKQRGYPEAVLLAR